MMITIEPCKSEGEAEELVHAIQDELEIACYEVEPDREFTVSDWGDAAVEVPAAEE